MKKSLLFAVAAVVLSACATKENPYTSELIPERTADGKILIQATMPEFVSTKAGVTDAGVFSWTVGDKIDVVYTKAESPDEIHTFECTNADGTFAYSGDITDGYAISGAYYPTGYNGTPSNQHFASLAAAAKGFQMHATVSAGKLAFAHDNAMFAVQVQNVPLFAKTVWVNGASVDITSETGNVYVRIPVIPAAANTLGIGVTDAAWDAAHNDLISKTSEKSAAIEAAKLYFLNDLEIAQTVHFLSDATGWSAVDGNRIDPVAGVSTKTEFKVLGGDVWFRFAVKYGALTVDYGYSAGKDYNNSDPFLANNTQGAKITSPGVYSVAFNFMTGAYTVTKTNEIMYLIGINGDWDTFDSSTNPLTPVFGKMLVWKGTPSNEEFKAYVYGETGWGTDNPNIHGASSAKEVAGPIYTGDSAKNCGTDKDDVVMVVFDYGTSPWYHSAGLVSDAAEKVVIEGTFKYNGTTGEWTEETGIALAKHATYPRIWYKEHFTIETAGLMKFVENGSKWYGGAEGMSVASYLNYRVYEDGGKNITIPAGTYTVYYNDIAHSYSFVQE